MILIIETETHYRNSLLARSPAPANKVEAEEKKPAQPKQKQEKKAKAEQKSENKTEHNNKRQENSSAAPSFSFLFGMFEYYLPKPMLTYYRIPLPKPIDAATCS